MTKINILGILSFLFHGFIWGNFHARNLENFKSAEKFANGNLACGKNFLRDRTPRAQGNTVLFRGAVFAVDVVISKYE